MLKYLSFGIAGAVASLGGLCLYKHFFKCKKPPIHRLYTSQDPNYSSIVIHKGIVYLSAIQSGYGDIEQQTISVLENIESLLTEAGSNWSNILEARIHLRNIERNFYTVMALWNGWIDPNNKGTMSCTESRFFDPNILVQIQVIASN
uniref:RidA family protein n=1 Tax=Lepeophtheirus salmonis TaxID=72036 RepID=A0A0K2UCJ5_LEPSM|nr:uncharacterized protein LOC121123290 [Lepeophtheirus salmonis]